MAALGFDVMSNLPTTGDATTSDPASGPQPHVPERQEAGKFTTGSTMRHVIVMTATGSVGLMAIFFVDLLNLFYISLLGQQELAAAIGYAGTILFFHTGVGIGVSIAVSALCSRALGARDRAGARRLAGSGIAFTAIIMSIISLLTIPMIDPLLTLLGATGTTKSLAARYLMITLPSAPLLGIGMAFSSVLRAVGDARRAMWVTLLGAIATAILDPIFIFGFGLALDGAAIVTVLARLTIACVGYYGAVHVHDLVERPSVTDMIRDAAALGAIAIPAILTNIATPVANAYITAELASFGDPAVAAWAVIGRIIPVAFGAVFALSGSIGPILGQNLGAKLYSRVMAAMKDAMVFCIIYVLVMWALLALGTDALTAMFKLTGSAAELFRFYCLYASGTFLFMGLLFVANTAFNNLGYPLLSTLFNWGRATLGTIPFAWLGGRLAGAEGVLMGQGVGGILFGTAAVITAFVVVKRMALKDQARTTTA
jgi:putative MATE family efflux protein